MCKALLYPEIRQLVDLLSKMEEVQKVYLYRHKLDQNGLSGFKLCVVCQTADKEKTEVNIYRQADVDIPFDVVLYTPNEWQQAVGEYSFASRVRREGCLLYGKE